MFIEDYMDQSSLLRFLEDFEKTLISFFALLTSFKVLVNLLIFRQLTLLTDLLVKLLEVDFDGFYPKINKIF